MTTKVVRIAGALGALIAFAAVTFLHAQSADSVAPGMSLARLTNEVHQLNVEFLQLRLEIEQARVETKERELQAIDESLRSLLAQEESVQHEVEDLRRLQLDPGLSPEQRAEIAITADESSTNGLVWLNDERVATERRQAALQAQLSQSYHTRSQLLARAADLGIAMPGQRDR